MERKLITKNDVLLIAGIAFVILLALFLKNSFNNNLIAQVYFDGEVIETINLSAKEEKKIVTGENGSTVIEAKDGKIYFESSVCPDKICVESGELEKNGDFASCLPEKVIVKVVGEKGNIPDAIVY